jgi:HK97 family phage major capsid protein
MKKSTELRQERQRHIDAQKNIVDGAVDDNKEKRSLTQEETEKFRSAQKEIERIKGEIEIAEQYEANQRSAAALSGSRVDGKTSEERELAKIKKRYSLHRAIRSQMPNGHLEGVELEIHQETVKRAHDAGVNITGVAIPIPDSQKRADGHTVTQDAGAYGANLVAEDLGSPIEFLRPKPILESLGARMITGLQGDVAFPTNDGGITATWEGEVATVSATKNAIGKKTMQPNRLAVHCLVSLQNLFQSSVDLERFTVEDINAVVANEFDAKAINGSGLNNQPTGILNVAGINSVVGGTNGAAPSWAHVVDLETKVYIANANAARMAYLINPATKGRLKQTKHTAGDLNYLMGPDNTINGYNVGVSNLVPSDLSKGTADPVSAAVFGDFSQLIMGQWGFYDLTVDNVSRKVDGYVALIVNTFLDCLVRQDKAFSAIKDWDLS